VWHYLADQCRQRLAARGEVCKGCLSLMDIISQSDDRLPGMTREREREEGEGRRGRSEIESDRETEYRER